MLLFILLYKLVLTFESLGKILKLDCSQSPIFRKIVEIEHFALRAAILDKCQN